MVVVDEDDPAEFWEHRWWCLWCWLWWLEAEAMRACWGGRRPCLSHSWREEEEGIRMVKCLSKGL